MSDAVRTETPQPTEYQAYYAEAIRGLSKDSMFLNNFETLFPITMRKGQLWAHTREEVKRSGIGNQKRAESNMSEEDRKKHSERWLGITWNDFFVDIDKAVIESELTLEQIKELRDKKWTGKDLDEREKLHYQLSVTLVPVYSRLREMGYTHDDLTI